ncbi:plectin [Zonotrichia leucophrys gambelii]|uniref:plectin n=1 Tax=Zonotrichia leucophrys gambelii TaxID=257770 RepID=UPI003140BA11
MAEESSSGSSGSPGAGDTLPWNLGKHQRSQRAKAAAGNGTVLDPAERAVIRIADERDRVQKKTFTKWVNKHLIKAQRHVNDLYEDLRDGHNLISLLEVLSGDTLPREKGRMRFHKLQNVQIALNYLKHRQVKLVNIRNDDIADGNPKLTLGLIWTIILHFQISDIQVTGQSEDMTAKEKLLLWSQRMVEDYQGLRCDNFTTSWRDGRLFNAIIHRHRPMLIDMSRVYRQNNLENLDQAFTVAERELGVTRLLDPEDVDVAQPDEKSIITYVSSLYDAMPRVPEVQDGVKANELQLRWQEYYEVVTGLLQWSRQHSALFEERRLPASYEEIEILWRQFLKFKETELPAREADKNRSKAIFQALEGAVQSGQLKVPPGYHPLDVEKEWGRLHVAVLEREKLLRAEFERLERLQRVVTKLQMESGLCEEQLNQADALLQADVRLLAAGKAPQKAAEVERDLDKADAMIRLLFNDVQTLKDGRHPQGEQMYRRVYRLHERLVSIRTEYNLRLKSGAPVTAVTSVAVTAAQQQRRPEPDDAPLRYLQELLAWVEENQRRVATAEWGADLPTVETHLGAHRGLHRAIEEFRSKVERARADESQLSPGPSGAYRECLGKLELQYAKLLNSSKSRLRHLESLHGFVSAATKELLWLSEREEEEVAFDWSHNNPAMAAKKESYSALMRELELRERRIQELRTSGERLLREEHPGAQTLEAFLAALQTQWSWMLQLCCCIETHLKENTNYFQFFAEVREAEELLRKTEETMRRKFSCDRGTTATRLEDLLQDLAEQKEQLAELGVQLGALSRRARTIVQLKPRSPSTPLQGRPPIQAVCDYKQMEVTVHKNDTCALVNHAQPQQWRVQSASGSEAVVPSVCFLLPPPNKEALDAVHRLEATHQQLLGLWQQLHQDLRSLRAWQYLMRDIQQIHSWTQVTFRTLPAEEVRQVLSSLERHYQEFLRDSQDSQSFQPDDRLQVERDYNACTHKYELLLRSQEKGEQDESLCKSYISQLKDIRLQLESCESRTVHRLRLPLKADPLRECAQRQAEQQQTHLELEGIQKNLAKVSEKTEQVLAQPEQAGSAPVLRSELEVTLRKMEQVYSLSSIYLEKLKTIGLVIRSTQGAEELLRKYEEQLKDVQAVPADLAELEASKAELKRLRAQAEGHQPFFSTLETDLGKAKDVNERMVRGHSERDVDLERYRERVQQLLERWQAVLGQADLRQRELDQLGRQLGYYRQSCDALRQWIRDARQRQEAIQAVPITDSQAVREQLLQEKKLLEECEQHKEKVEECQRYAKQYIDAIKDYELQLVSFKAQVEPVASPAKKPKVQSASDSIIQEYVDLRTQYSELTTLTTQYIKFITETLRRLEDEEKAAEKLKEEERKRLAEVEAQLEKQRQLAEAHAKAKAQAEAEARELQLRMQEEVTRREVVAVDAEQQKQNIQQELMQLRQNSDHQIKSKVKLIEEAEYNRKKVEEEIRLIRLQLESTEKQRESAETELQELRARAEDAERQKRQAQEEAERLRRQVKEESQKKREAEEELKRKVQAEREAAREKQKAVADLEQLRLQAEEAERRMRQAEAEKDRQIQVAQEVAQRSAEAELQSKRLSFAEKTAQLELSLQQEHDVVAQLQEEAERLKKQQLEAERSREEAEKELERWRQKANEALRLRLQAEEVAHKKSLAQEEAEKQKEDAEREARKRAKAEEVAVRQKELAEEELEKQRELAEGTAQQKLAAEQELIRLKAEMDNGEQQRLLLEEELSRLKGEVNEAIQRRKELEEELAKLRAEMEVLLESKAKTEEESRSSSEKSKQRLEAEANKLRELAEEAARLRALSEEAKRQRQLAEEEATRQRAEAERILKEKLAAINEASRLKAEAEIALKEKEAENERLRRLAEDEAYQRKLLEEQAAQHKQDIEEKIALLKRSSESELERQKGLVEDTLRQRRQVEEEIRALKASFERASAGKSELERELNRIRGEAEEVQRSREQAEREAERQRALALEEEGRRREAEEKVQAILAAEEEAGRQRRLALEEVERLRAMVEEARRQKELAEKESERQIQLAREAAQKRIAAEEKAHLAAVQQKEQELLQTRQQEQSLLDRLREEADRARQAAEEAEFARGKAEQDASLSRQRVEEAERLKQRAEEEAQAKAQAQADAEKLRKEAELEAAKRAQAEQVALRQKQLADAEMEKHKKFAEQTLRQKAQVEQELTKVKLQLDETDHQKGILDEELQRLKEEVTDAVRQKAQVEEELFKVRVQMEELAKLKSRIEEENKALILKDKDNTQKFLAEEAEKMKQVAEEVARLSVEAQEAARMRQLAEDDLAQQRALAEKMLKEKMQAVQEATRLRAEAEMLQKQKDLAQEHAKKLQEDKEQMQQRLAEETEGFQKTLEAERRRQLDITAEAERLKLQVAEMSMAQAKAEEEAKRFKKQAEEISERLHETELATQEKMTMVHTLEIQRHQSDEDAEKLRKAIADLEKEKEKLKQEAALLQQKAEEMQVAQQAQLRQETQLLQQSFLTEKDALLQKEKFIEEEKSKLEKLFKDEVNKAQNLKAEQERQQREMEQEKQQLKAMLDEAKKHQKEAEENVRHKQEELQQLEKQRQQQEKLLEEENQKLRERLEQMQEEYKAALAQRREIMIQTDDLPGEAVTTTQLLDVKAVPNGRDAMDGLAQNGEPEFAFDGIRQKVSAEKLADAGILSRENLDKLAKGVVSVDELSQREDVKKYLQGKSSIAGLLIKPSNQKMSIYEAMKKKLLSPGTALVLLEAQAASGFIIDPVRNARLSVNEAVREGVIGPELHNKMLSAERAVTGYKDPYTGDKISLFQAMQKDLIVRDHGIRLLEAQIATGGIIDPVNSHRLPVEAAYKRGYFDEEMNQVLSDPTDDTKGFFDPNTQENLTYLQLMERCVTDPDTGLCLLPLTDQAAKARELVYTDKEAKDVFKKATVTAPFGKFQGKTMTIWELINSEYFTEDQRRDLIQQYRTGKITVEKIIKIVITVVEESEKKSQMCFEGLRGPVPAAELLESKIINKDLYNQLHQGKKSVKDVAEMESVRQYLKGTDAIAGVLVESTGQKLTFYEALKRNLLRPEVALSLLEAQAATGYIIDPVGNKLFSVDEAVKAEVVGPEFHEKLLSAEKAVTGYKDPYTGQTVSLYQALQKGLIPSDTGLRLLDVQLATGGIIDPVNSHRLPLEVAYKRGYFDPEINKALTEFQDDAKAFYCPNTQEQLTYAQLQKSCHRDKQTGLCLLPLSDEAIQSQQEEIYTDSQAKECFDKATIEVPVGSMKGQTMTIWELIHSEYFTEEHRRELLRQYKTGKVTIEKIIKIVITIIEEAETKKQEKLTFSGLRAPVPASELLESCIISKTQYEQLKEGKKSVKDLSETDAVRRFLHGSDCIAGVYVEATKEKLNIYEAMRRNLLRPSTAVVLLEAQAATGFLIDPVKNRKLYVNEAVKAGIVGPELHEKLLSAEKAVTGYKDPYSGDTISLFQAMKKGLIVKEHGIRLLEAQIATGGIIDPVHSHRLPVEVAYKRGYFDEEMNRTLSDPTDDTKGFFDPNTQENLTYVQLKERCIEDPETGLYLLPLREPEKPKVVETTHVYTEAETRKVFEETQVDIPVGSRAGSTMSLWDVMHSDLLPEEQRKHLMEEFQSGRVSKERMIIIIIEIIEKTEIIRQQNLTSYDYVRRRITAEDLYEAKIITQDIYNLLKQGSKTFRELLDVETVWKYLYGSGCVAGIYIPSSKQTLSVYQALKKGLINSEVARSLLEAQAATGFMIDPTKNEMLTVDEAVRKGVVGPEIHDRLLSAERAVTGYRDPYSEQKISLFQAMKKDLIPSEEALKLLDAQIATGGIIDPHLGFHLPLEVALQRGFINKETYDMLSEPSEVRSYVDPSTDEKLSYTQLLKRCRKDENSRLLLLPLCDTRKLTFRGLRKQITVEELVLSKVMDEATAQRLQEGLTSVEEVSKNLKKFLEGTSCIAGVFVDSTKERLSIYQAMKKGIIRPGTAFELLEAQAATGYVIDPIKGLKLTVEEAVRMGIVGPEFKDKLLSAERAVTGYRDPYTGKLISLFQAMKKGLILKDHGIRLLEAQIATGGIIDPEESHRLPVEVAYKRGLFDEEMNEILLDPSDDTKGFFDPNTEENLTYLQLMERCITDPETGLCLLPLKEKKRERKTSSKSSVRKRRVVIVDPETGKEMSVYEAYRKGLIDHQTYLELSEQECEWEEITTSSSDGVVKSMIIDRRSGRQYDIDDAIGKGLIDQSALDQYRSGTLSITEFADMLSGNMGGFRSRSSSVGSSSSYTASPALSRTQISMWTDPTEETGPVAGILDTDTLEKVSITEAMRRNLVDNITGQRLLEAQACTGGIIDPNTGDKCTVADAVAKGLVDKIMVDRINLAQKAFYGFEDPRTKTKMSAAQALKKGWLYYEAGQRFLEVQYLTGGLIEPDAPGRVSLDDALQKGTIDARTAQKLRDVNTYSKYLTCPKTKLKISYKDAMDRSMIEDGTGLRLLEASSQSSKGYYSPYNISSAGSTSGSRSGSRTGSRSGSRRGSFDATGSSFSMTFSSSSYSSSSFGRRYAGGTQGTVEEAALALALAASRSCGWEASRECPGVSGPLLHPLHPKGGDCLGPVVHPTATNVPEEDITSSSALDSQTHHTSPEAAAWTPSTRPQCSEEGALHPSPPSCPISLPQPPGTSPPPRRRAGALTVSAALALPGASAPCGGTCLRSPLRPPRGFAACPPPPAHPLTRPPGRARRGRPTSFSSPNKDLPVPLGELLSWVSDISRSWTGSRGAPEAAAARLCPPAQCGWMSIPLPLIAAMEPVPHPEAASCHGLYGLLQVVVKCRGRGHRLGPAGTERLPARCAHRPGRCWLGPRRAGNALFSSSTKPGRPLPRPPRAGALNLPMARDPRTPPALPLRLGARVHRVVGDTRDGVEGSPWDREELERACLRSEQRLEVQEQLLALRHWLDAVEKRLLALPEPGTALQPVLLCPCPGAEPQRQQRSGGCRPPPPRRPSPAPFVGGLAGTRAPSAHMTAQTERAIHCGPGADKAEAAQKPTRLPGSEAVHSSRPLPPGAPRRAPLPGAPVPPRARYLGLRSVPGELPAAAGDGGGGRLRPASSAPAQLLPGRSRPGSVGAVGARSTVRSDPAGCPAPRCHQRKAPEPCGEEDDAELLQDAAEPPRPWQMLIPGSVSGSRQSPRPRRPPLPGDPREPHPSAWPTRLQRPPGSRGPARGTRAGESTVPVLVPVLVSVPVQVLRQVQGQQQVQVLVPMPVLVSEQVPVSVPVQVPGQVPVLVQVPVQVPGQVPVLRRCRCRFPGQRGVRTLAPPGGAGRAEGRHRPSPAGWLRGPGGFPDQPRRARRCRCQGLRPVPPRSPRAAGAAHKGGGAGAAVTGTESPPAASAPLPRAGRAPPERPLLGDPQDRRARSGSAVERGVESSAGRDLRRGPGARAMGNSVSRPSCLGEKSRRPEELLREPGLDAGQPPAGDVAEAWPGLLEKAAVPVENGWSPGPGVARSRPGSPVLRRSQSEVAVQNGGAAAVRGQVGGATWTPPRAGAPRSTWSWKPVTTREVTEVTEVTETIVTEIVEVTEYPAGDKGGEPVVTRTVTVLTECVGELAAAAGHTDATEVSSRAVPVPEEAAERGQETLERLLAWVADMEELVSNQKPPSAEAKVVKAQLEEQKVRCQKSAGPPAEGAGGEPRVELVLQDRLTAPEGSASLFSLGERWDKLMQEAEARYGCLERILPAAQGFQEAVDAFQEWLGATERQLAQLWRADGCVGRVQDAYQQTQALCEEIRGRLGELDGALESGQRVLELVTGEEAQLTQEKMESLRMRYLIVGQSSADTAHRLGQTLEASSRLGTAPEDLALWLSRMEKELGEQESQQDGQEPSVTASDREKFEQVLESQLSRVAGLGERLEEIGRVQLDAEALRSQLSEQKLLSAEILHCRGLVERLLGFSEPLLRCCPEPLRQRLQPLVQALQERTEQLSLRSGACAVQLEHAQSLLTQFSEALEELLPWLEETQALGVQLSPNAISYEAFKEQQALLQSLREAIAEHRPLVGKLQRVSAQLLDLSPEQAAPFQRRWQELEEQYGHIRERVRQAAALLEDALPRYSQLSERMDLLLECLERLQSRLQSQPPVRGDAAHLREQIRENSLALGELEKLGVALEGIRAQGEELLATMQAVSSDAADRGIQERTEQLLSLWGCLHGRCQERERWLRELLALAERFWHGLSELAVALSDTQQLVLGLEEAGSEPEAIRTRLRTMQALREDIDALQGELDTLGSLGVELMASCGDPDKPDVTKSLDDLYSSWHSLSRVWTERNGRLEEQLQAALSYQDTMQRLLEWLDAAELRIAEEFLVGGDLDMVQQQLAELKEFKRELYQCKVDVESLRHQGGTGQGEPPATLCDFRQRWDHLEEEIVSRQHQLEAALLGLGQFHTQLAELLQWLSRTGEQLRGPAPLRPDLQSCEIELAKHKVLRTDVMSHARTVQSVTEAGQGLLLSSLGESVEGLQRSLQELEQHWELVRSETESRQLELENNLSQVQDITLEITELLQWLEQVELQLFCSKPAWGHPDATKEKLNAHLELCRELEARAGSYRGLRERLQRLLDSCRAGRPCSTEHSLRLLEQKWDSVQAEAQERKERLAEGLTVSTEFHGSAQELLRWVAHAEELLGSPAPPSFVLDTVTAQIQEHKALVKEANAHGEKLGGLEAVAARLKDFSRKQDGAVIQNLVLAARERLGKVLQRAAERGAVLEEARKRSKQFSESRRLLLDWMDEVEQSLEEPQDAATSQEEIKCQLAEHKAFQKVLRAKRPVYEATLRSGRALREGARLPQDLQPLEELLGELKERWDALCSHAAERQHKLEENLLFSGKFTDALQALMDWLYRAEPQLSEDAPVGGDRDLVGDLMDKHKVFQKELGKRASCIKTLKRSVRDLTRGSSSVDSQWLQRQVEELSTRWDLVCKLSLAKQARLEAALRQAEEFHTLVHSFLGRLTESEKTLKYGVFPEEEAAVHECQAQLQELMQSLQCQQLELECITSLGEEILSTCHPDSVITIKSWVTVAKSRFQEVLSWAQQQGERLRAQAAALAAEREDTEQLLEWITAAEEALGLRDQEPLPEEAEPLEELSAQHAVFMEELNRKQPDVEKVTKSCKRKLAVDLGPPATRRLATRRRSSGKAQGTAAAPLGALEPQTPLMAQLLHRWQQLWLLALDRQYRLETALQRLRELEEFAHFDFGVWRKRYMQWISQMKSRVLDVFRGIDRDQDGRISQREFIESVLASKFPTNVLEMNAVATIFDMNGDGFIDYYEFVSALHPNRDPLRRSADADQIQDEVNRQVAQCNCAKRFQVEQISANRYRFGESQQLRMVRILRSTLMVRVGGGWIALDEFLVKNDPCRVKGRTNLKINEKYLSSDVFGAAARCAGTQSAASSKVLSPSRSNSSLSLYSSASAPSSPLARKSVLRRTRSGDRCPRSRGSGLPDGAELQFSAAEESLPVAPPEPPEGSPPERCSPCR